jgi:hypothetical protein
MPRMTCTDQAPFRSGPRGSQSAVWPISHRMAISATVIQWSQIVVRSYRFSARAMSGVPGRFPIAKIFAVGSRRSRHNFAAGLCAGNHAFHHPRAPSLSNTDEAVIGGGTLTVDRWNRQCSELVHSNSLTWPGFTRATWPNSLPRLNRAHSCPVANRGGREETEPPILMTKDRRRRRPREAEEKLPRLGEGMYS